MKMNTAFLVLNVLVVGMVDGSGLHGCDRGSKPSYSDPDASSAVNPCPNGSYLDLSFPACRLCTHSCPVGYRMLLYPCGPFHNVQCSLMASTNNAMTAISSVRPTTAKSTRTTTRTTPITTRATKTETTLTTALPTTTSSSTRTFNASDTAAKLLTTTMLPSHTRDTIITATTTKELQNLTSGSMITATTIERDTQSKTDNSAKLSNTAGGVPSKDNTKGASTIENKTNNASQDVDQQFFSSEVGLFAAMALLALGSSFGTGLVLWCVMHRRHGRHNSPPLQSNSIMHNNGNDIQISTPTPIPIIPTLLHQVDASNATSIESHALQNRAGNAAPALSSFARANAIHPHTDDISINNPHLLTPAQRFHSSNNTGAESPDDGGASKSDNEILSDLWDTTVAHNDVLSIPQSVRAPVSMYNRDEGGKSRESGNFVGHDVARSWQECRQQQQLYSEDAGFATVVAAPTREGFAAGMLREMQSFSLSLDKDCTASALATTSLPSPATTSNVLLKARCKPSVTTSPQQSPRPAPRRPTRRTRPSCHNMTRTERTTNSSYEIGKGGAGGRDGRENEVVVLVEEEGVMV